jgi:Holliday junction DNA helicase RuvA
VIAGDADALTVVPGVGKKVAQRVVVELRDRLGGEAELPSEGGPIVDVREALVSLGLSAQEAAEATRDVDADGRDVDDLLREALQKVGR